MSNIGIWKGAIPSGYDRDNYNPETIYDRSSINQTKYQKSSRYFIGASSRPTNRGEALVGRGLLENLVAYYRFENNLQDSYAGYHLISGSGASYITGKFGAAINSGSDYSVQFNNTDFNKSMYEAEFTLAFWCKPTFTEDTNEGGAMIGWNNIYEFGVGSYDSLGKFLAFSTGPLIVFPSPGHAGRYYLELNSNDFFHVAVTYNRLVFKIYINGNFVDTGRYYTGSDNPYNYSQIINDEHFFVTPNVEWNTGIDELGVWSKELEAHQISYLYNNGQGFDPTK